MRPAAGIAAVASLGLFVALAASVAAQRSPSPPAQTAGADATARIVASAQAFLGTLDEAGRTKVQFPFDSPQKARWSNLPTGIYKREGLRLGDLTLPQRAAAMAILSAAFSPDGTRVASASADGTANATFWGRRI
jgi:WD40 repeat protein